MTDVRRHEPTTRRVYRFFYKTAAYPQGMPGHLPVDANDTDQACNNIFTGKLEVFLKASKGELVPGSITCKVERVYLVADPSPSERYFAHKAAHPEPVPFEKLTPLQQRMQSGGA